MNLRLLNRPLCGLKTTRGTRPTVVLLLVPWYPSAATEMLCPVVGQHLPFLSNGHSAGVPSNSTHVGRGSHHSAFGSL